MRKLRALIYGLPADSALVISSGLRGAMTPAPAELEEAPALSSKEEQRAFFGPKRKG